MNPQDLKFRWWPLGEPDLSTLKGLPAILTQSMHDLLQAAWFDGFRTGLAVASIGLIVLYLLSRKPQ